MNWLKIAAEITLALVLLGCAADRKQLLQAQQSQMRIRELETELKQKDAEIIQLEERLEGMKKDNRLSLKYKEIKEPKGSPSNIKSPRNIQLALKNAGYYTGPIDGKIGKRTKEAIKEFQQAKGLAADGIVGKQTWLKLMKYLQ